MGNSHLGNSTMSNDKMSNKKMSNSKRDIPRVSIGMPVYNGARYIEAALESLLGQTHRDFELIIADNGSTDATPSICEAAAARDERIRFVRYEENRGAVWNFNHLAELARGEFFKWAAHDDVCDPTWLERCVAALDEHPEAVLSLTRTALIDEHGKWLKGQELEHSEEGGLEQTRPHQRLGELLLNRVWVHEAFSLVRLATLRQTRLLPRYVGAEKVLYAELALRGTFFQVPEVLFHSRWHSDQASWIASASEERQWRDPRAPNRTLVPYHVKCVVGHTGAILGAPLSLAQRVRCQAELMRWVLQFGKWRKLLSRFLNGWGSGGGRASSTAQHAG